MQFSMKVTGLLGTVLCRLVVSLQMQNRKTTDKINEISIVPNPPNYSIVVIAGQRALHLHFATDNQLAKPCNKGPEGSLIIQDLGKQEPKIAAMWARATQ